MIISLLEGLRAKTVSIINPGQGYTSLAVSKFLPVEKMNLVSSDLLQLKISSENLILNGFNNLEVINKDVCEVKSDLLLWSIHDEDDAEISEKLKIYKKNNAQIILAGKKTRLSRVLKYLNIKPKKEDEMWKYVCVLI